MKQRIALVGLMALVAHVGAFAPPLLPRPTTRVASSASRFEGNQRLPTAEELALMDEMIDKLADAKPYELPGAVKRAFRIIRSPRFFLRIAERTDKAKSDEDRTKLEALAANLVSTLEVVVETTIEKLDERAGDVESVVKAAAEPDSGEFLVPLTPARIAAMKAEIEGLSEASLDEGFLATLEAWIIKSHQDGMDLMVGILQKVLQMYAGLQIKRSLERATEFKDDDKTDLFELLSNDADLWASQMKTYKDLASLKKQVQKTMETIILSLETGSMAQQVQAEYLKELLNRVEEAEKAK